jgi:ribosomal protein L11 methyltransferase
MDYIKLNCWIEPDNDLHREILIAELGALGFESFLETNDLIEAYIPSAQFSNELINKDSYIKDKLFAFNFTVENIPDQNWNEVWEKNYFKSLIIKGQCLIRAPHHTDYPKVKYEIIIDPKMSFGTGNHETTFLMVSEILENDFRGKKVLDIGCGTGILGILASKLGADSVTCIDIDEWAYRNSIENASFNHIYNLEVKLGGVEIINGKTYDFILANIQRNILLNDLQLYHDSLMKEGLLIMSGFYYEDLPAIQLKAADLGLKFISHREKNKWIAAKFSLE